MIFFLNLNGTCTRQDTDHVYQGSNNASKVIAITGIAPGQSHVDVAFTLPNGLTVGYLPMVYKGAYKLEDSSAVSMHLWELNLPYNVTEMQGTVGVSFNAVTGITEENPKGNNLTSYTNTFEVEYSALPELPSSATESELEQILNLLEAYAAVNPEIVEKLENFQIGTITAQAGEPGTQPRVTAEIVNKSLPNGYDLNMNFTLPTGEPAGFNRVTAEAETISAGSFAEADVTTSGPNTSKNFAFKFKIPKGDKGTSGQDGLDGAGVFALKQVYDSTTTKIPASDVEIPAGRYGQIKEFDMLIDTSGNMFRALAGNTPLNGNIITVRYYTSIKGEIGNTPDITVNATVDNAVGIPSVTVTESGTPEAPEINLSFHNLKGEPGDVSGSVTGVKGNNEADYRQGLVNLTPENIGAPSTSGTYEDLVVGSATSFTRHPLTSDDDLDNFKNEGYYVWAASQPQNSPCAFASMIIMWASSNNYPKQIVFRQGSMGNASGQYTSDEIWLRSYNVDNGVWTDWVLIPTLRYLTSNFSNRNLLVNPTFEINQREQVRYTGNANYTVDRWKSISANNIIIPLTRGGVRFINGYNSNSYIKQILEEDYSGLKLTFSANVSAINAGSARMAMYYTTADNTNTWTLINGGLTIDNSGVHSLTVTVPKSATAISADLGGTGFADIEFLWAKLEISPFATRFEPPNIAEELAKCQRYYQTGYYFCTARDTYNMYAPCIKFNKMRQTPTSKIYAVNGAAEQVSTVGTTIYALFSLNGQVVDIGRTLQYLTPDSAVINSGGSFVANTNYFFKYTLDAEL